MSADWERSVWYLCTDTTNIDVRNKLHDVHNFISRQETSIAALLNDVRSDIVLFSFENGSLMKADGRGMYVHVEVDNLGIFYTSR